MTTNSLKDKMEVEMPRKRWPLIRVLLLVASAVFALLLIIAAYQFVLLGAVESKTSNLLATASLALISFAILEEMYLE